jgi:hypothetical protein
MDVSTMNKDELFDFALKQFGVTIDKRRRLEELQAQVAKYQTIGARTKPKVMPGERVPAFVRNIRTGVVWPWNPLYKGNPDLEVIEWEPENAEPEGH